MSKQDTTFAQPGPTVASPKEETQLLPPSNLDREKRKQPYPKSIFFIVGNEFCERFSYFGMRAILVLYLTQWLRFDKDWATSIYHGFVVLCYVMPLFGAMLADGYIGKYKTIIILSIVYICGNIVMTFTAFPPPFWVGPMIGLVLIGTGTGGIKPCVSAFGGDQFSSEQQKQRVQFFSIFYFTINLGSFTSMIVTPVIREYSRCFGSSCYPVAFGLPAVLMIVSLGLFWIGRGLYKIFPPTGSVIKNFFSCIGRAIKNRWQMGNVNKAHWLDYAEDEHDAAFIEDLKRVLRVFVLFIPLPAFWALFDQQGSRWTLQSIQLNRRVCGNWHVLPDQIQAINPLLIVILIPLFEGVIYPLLDKCRCPNRPLQRMVSGMSLTALSFIAAGCLQLRIDSTLLNLKLEVNQSSVYHINVAPCPVKLNSPWKNGVLEPLNHTHRQVVNSSSYTFTLEISDKIWKSSNDSCRLFAEPTSNKIEALLKSGSAYFSLSAMKSNGMLQSKVFEYPLQKSSSGGTLIGIVYINPGESTSALPTGYLTDASYNSFSFNLSDFGNTVYRHIPPGRYSIGLSVNSSDIIVEDGFFASSGAVYTLVIMPNSTSPVTYQVLTFIDVEPNSVSVWYQFPQYVLITVGETLFAVTGLSFAYSQAPESMKSVVQAGWLLTTAVGNMLDVIIASLHISSQAVEFFFFSILMAVTTVIFAVMSHFYKYAEGSTLSKLETRNPDERALVDSGDAPVRQDENKE